MYIGNDLRSGRAEVFHYTSTSGGETVVTTASDGRSIRYDVGYCNVYLNGVRLHDSDYAATTGTSITNLAALSQNDVLIVEAPSTFSSTNTVPASGGSFTGPLTIDGGINQKAAAQDLSGTYANERMYINDAYTLKGDVSITGHLALGSISSGDIVISDDGNNREISGTGTLETGGILQERNTLLTGMTGELGSAVTGSPAINLSNVTGSPANRHYFLATKTANQTINNNTTNLVTWDMDVYSSWDGSKGLDLTNNYWVCPETGYYWLYFMHRLTDGDDAGGGQIWNLTKNQTITAAAQSTVDNHLFGSLVDEDSAYIPNATNGQVCLLSSGDIIRFYCTNNHGTNESIQAGSDGWYQTKFGGYILR